MDAASLAIGWGRAVRRPAVLTATVSVALVTCYALVVLVTGGKFADGSVLAGIALALVIGVMVAIPATAVAVAVASVVWIARGGHRQHSSRPAPAPSPRPQVVRADPGEIEASRRALIANQQRQADETRRRAQQSGAVPAAPLAPIKPAPERQRPEPVVDLSDGERLNRVLDELDSMPGMEAVAEQVRAMARKALLDQRRKAEGLPVAESGFHALFLGPAGTGKTSIARVWGRALAAIGVLPHGNVVEVDRSDLVAGHVGQTGPKTLAKVREAMGGVLFIDEAYSLHSEGGTDFGSEAVAALLKAMEDKRGEFVVVAAGYEREMATFLDSNSGLRSRFSKTITFPAYDGPACVAILDSMCEDAGYRLDETARETAARALARLAAVQPKGWGNGRSVRGLLAAATDAQATRLSAAVEPTRDQLVVLTGTDMEAALAVTWPDFA